MWGQVLKSDNYSHNESGRALTMGIAMKVLFLIKMVKHWKEKSKKKCDDNCREIYFMYPINLK